MDVAASRIFLDFLGQHMYLCCVFVIAGIYSVCHNCVKLLVLLGYSIIRVVRKNSGSNATFSRVHSKFVRNFDFKQKSCRSVVTNTQLSDILVILTLCYFISAYRAYTHCLELHVLHRELTVG